VKFLKRFFDGVQRDLRLFVFVLILLEIYRGLFIWLMSNYLAAETGSAQIAAALFAGLRLSLKTAGAVTLISFVLVSVVGLNSRLRLLVGFFASLIFSLLFMLRFPYYRAFQSTFGLEVVQGIHDDIWSIIVTMFQEYGIAWRFLVAVILTLICMAILSRLLLLRTIPLPPLEGTPKVAGFSLALAAGIFAFALFVRFGGSFTYGSGLNWENAGVTTDDFLNECILDDGQALYRARAMAKRMEAGEISGVDPEKIQLAAQIVAGNENLTEENLAPYLERKAHGERIPRPKHIFIILGETFMQWPMLGKYGDLFVAEGIKSLIAEENCYYSRNFMPNGDFTSTAITGLVTGLPDVNIRVNYQARTYEKLYLTSMATPFKEIGYAVDFWYGGMPSWDSIAKMSLAQGFDNFYGYPDFHAPKQTTWGTKDENLFNALLENLDEVPTVHLVMTTTNHPPYNLDLAAEGYDVAAVKAELEKLPDVDDPYQLAVELGHYWYMDRVITNFVRAATEKYPNSLFVITGDHAVRCDPSTHPTIFEHQSVPFVLFGAGVTKNILPPDVVGDHISIVPTLLEMIAPKDFAYYSIAPSLFDSDGVGFNNSSFLTGKVVGQIDSDDVELLPHLASGALDDVNLTDEREHALKIIGAMRTVAWWMITKGLFFGDATKTEGSE